MVGWLLLLPQGGALGFLFLGVDILAREFDDNFGDLTRAIRNEAARDLGSSVKDFDSKFKEQVGRAAQPCPMNGSRTWSASQSIRLLCLPTRLRVPIRTSPARRHQFGIPLLPGVQQLLDRIGMVGRYVLTLSNVLHKVVELRDCGTACSPPAPEQLPGLGVILGGRF